MSEQLSRIHRLFKYSDGDQIDARMGVQIATGHGITQYWDEQQNRVVSTDFTQYPPTLYPFPYSSKRGEYVVPATQGQQWYYNNPETDSAGILDASGNVKTAYASLFEKTTVTIGTKTFPALKIIGNLATAADHTDKHIYYKSTYQGKTFMCSMLIPVQTTVGNATEILISMTTQDGSGSPVLSNSNNYVQMTAYLQRGGTNVSGSVTYQWQKLVNGVWTNVTTQMGTIELSNSGQTVKVMNPAVDSEDLFRVAVTYNGETKYKMQQLTDTTDTYFIYEGCSIAGESVPDGVNVTFNPVVYNRHTQVADTAYSWYFKFLMTNIVTGDQIGNATIAQTYTVTSQTLDQYEGVNVVIMASNEAWT